MSTTPAGVLLDIEGTTSSIAFVYDVMFPYAKEHVLEFLGANWKRSDVQEAVELVAKDASNTTADDWLNPYADSDRIKVVGRYLLELMTTDSKATGLKAVQGLVWADGFRSGELRSHLFDDVVPSLRRWRDRGIRLGIYSSGSVVAQKLFFGHTEFGDLRPLFECHFDTTTGPKRDSASYTKIAQLWGIDPSSILFLTDVAAEWQAAREAEFQSTIVIRPGNAKIPDTFNGPTIESFDDLGF